MGVEQLIVEEYNIIFYSVMMNSHNFGSGYGVHESLEAHIGEFNPVLKKIAVLRIDTAPLNIVLICVYAPTKVSLGGDIKTLSIKTSIECMTKHQEM